MPLRTVANGSMALNYLEKIENFRAEPGCAVPLALRYLLISFFVKRGGRLLHETQQYMHPFTLFLGRLLALATAGNEDVLAGLLLLRLFQKRRDCDSPSCSD